MATVAFDTTNSPTSQSSPKKGGTITTLVAVNTSQPSCDVLDFRGFKHLSVKPPTGVTSLTFYGCNTSGGTFVLINDLGTNGAVTVTASVWNMIDYTKLAPHHFIQMKSAGANGNAVCLAST